MSTIVEIVMPKLGESIMEATILKWHKNIGESIQMDETLLDIATDKVDSEVPSTAEGIVTEILFNTNDVVPIGAVIAKISSQQSNGISVPPATPSIQQQSVTTSTPAVVTQVMAQPEYAQSVYTAPTTVVSNNVTNRFYSPLVLNIASSEGVSMQELENITGSGNEGRVTKKDILQYVTEKKGGNGISIPNIPSLTANKIVSTPTPPQQVLQPATTAETTQPKKVAISGNVEIIEMDRMRKLIAKHMVDSKHTSPHVTSFTEADVTNLVQWREHHKKAFEKQEGTKLTFTPLFMEAIVKCIKKYPIINSSVDGDTIIIKKDINLGMATALPNGNLIVPVIKNAGQLNLTGMAKQVNALADNARNSHLKADDTQGGTFTLTNVGTFGSLMGTPIINQPQVAILAVGAIKKRPVVIETPQGDSIAIRHMMYLSLSYDHRIVDGSLGASFLTAVANELEAFDINRTV
jgi:2-oxoglutarate dehydrogenase E2 component (dihydrolipoamide succinyltransferase)